MAATAAPSDPPTQHGAGSSLPGAKRRARMADAMRERVGRCVHLTCIGRRVGYLKRRPGTSHIASAAMRQDILLFPRWRSRNTIGTSTTRKPARTAR